MDKITKTLKELGLGSFENQKMVKFTVSSSIGNRDLYALPIVKDRLISKDDEQKIVLKLDGHNVDTDAAELLVALLYGDVKELSDEYLECDNTSIMDKLFVYQWLDDNALDLCDFNNFKYELLDELRRLVTYYDYMTAEVKIYLKKITDSKGNMGLSKRSVISGIGVVAEKDKLTGLYIDNVNTAWTELAEYLSGPDMRKILVPIESYNALHIVRTMSMAGNREMLKITNIGPKAIKVMENMLGIKIAGTRFADVLTHGIGVLKHDEYAVKVTDVTE